MPWTVADVDSHKKGLTDKQKKQWCRIANSVLAACLKKGGTDKTCAPSAIKQANGAVMNVNESKGKYVICKNKQILDYEPKLTVHQEKAHLVVPVVMMVEGVHNGSQGALLHEISELGKFPDSWNGIPVVIYHPTKDDEPVSANSPEIIDTRTVGRVYNTTVEGKKLKAEVWFDEDKLNSISEDTLLAINESKEIEVSLGMFTENEEKEGEYEGEKYVGIAKNHRPDHLAILPDEKGACSCADGCGIGANKEIKDIQPSQVTEKAGVEQVVNNGLTRNKFSTNNKKEETKMAKNECPKCLEKINAVITNKASGFDETDRGWLECLTEPQLDKAITPKVKEVEKIVEKKVEVNKLTPEQEADLAFVAKQRADKRNEMIQGIQTNTSKELWPDDVLKVMNEDNLKRVFDSVKKPEQVNYLGDGIQSNSGTEEPPLLTAELRAKLIKK